MSRISYVRVLVELDLLGDLKSFIVINLPNGATLNQPVIYETLPRFCKLCKVLRHNTGTCTSHPAPVVARPLGKNNLPPIVATRGRSVFDRLGSVAEPNLGKTKGQIGESSQNYDPMTTEAAVATDGWEIIKSKKARKSPGIPVSATPATAQVLTTPLEVKHLLTHLQEVFVPLFATSLSSIMGKNQLEQTHTGKILMWFLLV
jgi:hypothetical protein